MKYRVSVAGRSLEIEVDGGQRVWVNGQPLYVHLEQVGHMPLYTLALDDMGYVVFLEAGPGQYQAEIDGQVYPVEVVEERPALRAPKGSCRDGEQGCMVLCAPLAGHLVSLAVAAGEQIASGQVAAVVESMKMQMEIKAPLGGIVAAVHGPAGRDVSQGAALVTIQVQPDPAHTP